MSNKIIKPLTLAVGAAFIGSFTLSQMVHANSAFQVKPLISGYMLAGTEGKCGEGKCATTKLDTNKDGKVSKEEAMAGGFSENQVKAWDKDGDGHLDTAELAAMHTAMDKKGKEGSCTANKKGKEGSCSAEKKAAADKKGKEGSCSSK